MSHSQARGLRVPSRVAQPHLNRMESGCGAAYAFHCGDGRAMQRADGGQAGVDGMMPSDAKRSRGDKLRIP